MSAAQSLRSKPIEALNCSITGSTAASEKAPPQSLLPPEEEDEEEENMRRVAVDPRATKMRIFRAQ